MGKPGTAGVAVGLDVGLDVGAAVDVDVGDGEGEAVEVDVGDGLGVGPSVTQIPFVMVLVSSVTSPVRANNCPCTVAPVCAAMDAIAKMCPTKVELVPKVAELGTTQKTRQNRAPLIRRTTLLDAVISVAVLWKMKTALGSPLASSVRVPVIPRTPPEL